MKPDSFIKSPSVSLCGKFHHCGVPLSTPSSSIFARLVSGVFYFAIRNRTIYETIKSGWKKYCFKIKLTCWVLALLGLAITGLSPAFGADAPTTLQKKFQQANEAYSEGKFAEAQTQYQDLLRIAGPSAELYYNLGCAAFKAGKLGPAVVNFHRAARLAPRDEDIRANLKFISALVRPENEGANQQDNPLFSLLTGWVFLLSSSEVALLQLYVLLIFALGATGLALGGSGALRKISLWLTMAGLVLLLVSGTLLGIHYYRDHYERNAVVVTANAEARSGPGEDNTRVLVLPEGAVIRLREQRTGWALVSLASGRSGWIKESMLEEI